METLFPIGPVMPYGFSYYPDFISLEQEQLSLDTISKMDLHTLIFQGYKAKRKVDTFGYSITSIPVPSPRESQYPKR